MAEIDCAPLDPRIRRTRRLLQQALEKLLETQDFEKISVQDITDAATLNRATFYDHYPDKTALLTCMVGSRFHQLLAQRNVQFDDDCAAALRAIVLAVCDHLVRLQGPDAKRQLEPHMESAIIAVVRRILMDGMKQHSLPREVPPELLAATISWAIYGAAKEWAQTPDRCPSEEIVGTIAGIISSLFHGVAVAAETVKT